MTAEQEKAIYREASARYGLQAETLILAEECSELVKACCKACRAVQDGNFDNYENHLMAMAEEIADVKVVIGQMMSYYEIPEEMIERIKIEKLERLKRRMEGLPD